MTYDPTYRSPLLYLRKTFDLYANIRPVKRLHPSIGLVDLDVVIVRENTEGMYTGVEREVQDGIITERKVTRKACQRIVDKGLEHLPNGGTEEHHLRAQGQCSAPFRRAVPRGVLGTGQGRADRKVGNCWSTPPRPPWCSSRRSWTAW